MHEERCQSCAMDPKLLDNTFDRISAVAQCRDLETIMEIADQVAGSVDAKSHVLVRFAFANSGANELLPLWNTLPLADLYAGLGFGRSDPIQRALARLRRPVTEAMIAREESGDVERLTRFMNESGVSGFVAAPAFKDAGVAAAFILFYSSAAPSEAAWVAGLVAPVLFERAVLRAEAPVGGQQAKPPNMLTPRELECLIWSADGKTSWEISEILAVSERTVNAHLGRAIRKLGVVSRTQAVAEAIRRGLFQ